MRKYGDVFTQGVLFKQDVSTEVHCFSWCVCRESVEGILHRLQLFCHRIVLYNSPEWYLDLSKIHLSLK